MTTDRELLELAAKAGGIEFNEKRSPTGNIALHCPQSVGWWNPLNDDGDALRLAVKLKINLSFSQDCAFGFWIGTPKDGEDLSSHARRAIVQAAAEIGRNMK